MSADPGTTIGPYTIDREIGRGGMGVVLLATDTRLHRQVALKALPPDLATDPDRLQRFEREARILASLTHANIAGIHAVEHGDDNHQYLVLEYVPGDTLADRLARGPLPVDEALHVASQIAAGVAAAHDAGIVHRDLKPANIKITPDGHVKVLDFGIAKALAPELSTTITASPTLTVPQTQPGAVLGTTPYMSPEQARGKPIDKRTDVWSFACILYECLTGARAFPGDNTADVMGAIVERDPDWNALPANTPYRVRDLLQRCLAKDKAKRLRDIGDARIELDLARDNREWSTTSLAGQPTFAPKRRVPWGMIALAGVVVIALAAQFLSGNRASPPEPPASPVRFSIDPLDVPERNQAISAVGYRPIIGPDGSAIAYTASAGEGWAIYIRRLDELTPRRLPGTENAGSPTFSPDSQWLSFVSSDNALMKLPLQGGPLQTICRFPLHVGRDIQWLPDGSILFTLEYGSSIARIGPTGGTPEIVLKTDPDAGIKGIERFCALPEGRGILFGAWDGATIESFNVFVLESGSTQPRRLIENASHPNLLDSGYLIFLGDDTLLGVRFNLKTLEISGTPAPVLTGVATDTWGGTGFYDLSPGGTLVYRPGQRLAADRNLVFVDPTGAVERITQKPDAFFSTLSASPDGRYLTIATLRRRFEFWLYDLQRHAMTTIGGRGEFHKVAWTPDARSFTYCGYDPEGSYEKTIGFTRAVDGGSVPQSLDVEMENWWPHVWTRDGKLLLTSFGTGNEDQVFSYDPSVPALAHSFKADAYVFNLALSPDGKWLAYSQYRTGEAASHVFVRRYPDDGRSWQVSFDDVDDSPHWSPDGKTLYFANDATMYAVDIETEPEFRAGPARPAFEWPFPDSQPDWSEVVMHPNGRFVMIEPALWERRPARFNVVLHFDEVVREALEGAK